MHPPSDLDRPQVEPSTGSLSRRVCASALVVSVGLVVVGVAAFGAVAAAQARRTQPPLQTATRARELANQQLQQSRDRFAAGVASNIEVIQAQEAVTLANEQYIAALYGFNVSKALLARSLGTAEEAVQRYLGGSNP